MYKEVEEENRKLVNKIASLEEDLDTMRTRMQNLQSTILSNISHDIRTPMNAIVGFANLLMAEKLDEQEKLECLQQINSNSNDLLEIVDNMIDASLLQSGELVLSSGKCYLNELMDELYTMCQELFHFRQKELSIVVSKSGDDEMYALADHRRLKQVFKNLIYNALKYTEKGYVKFGYTISDAGKADFFVKDTGIGISTLDEEALFTPFRSRLLSENGSTSKGAGLGLSVSKKLIELMGGNMWHETCPGNGTCFYFSLPGKKISFIKRTIKQINSAAKRSIASFL